MSFPVEVKTATDPININLEIGETLFILGANGAGKSSLMQKIYIANRILSRRISAHRQTWFASGTLSLSSEQKKRLCHNYLLVLGNYLIMKDFSLIIKTLKPMINKYLVNF